jgi:hypothetical protein
MKQPRLLRANEISCRIQQVTDNKGAIVLLYKDARVDMAILDETYGPMNWQRKHDVVNGNLFCTIDIWDDEKKQWVSKQDVGVESNTEATKGEASDAFKRAGFNWSIGRELYTAPFVFVQLSDDECYINKSGKQAAKSSFGLEVASITYNEETREITSLVLKDRKGKVRFTHGAMVPMSKTTPEPIAPVQPSAADLQAMKIQRMKMIASDVQKYTKSKDRATIREGIEAAEVWMRVNKRYDGKEYEAMNTQEFAAYLKALNDFYTKQDTGEAVAV